MGAVHLALKQVAYKSYSRIYKQPLKLIGLTANTINLWMMCRRFCLVLITPWKIAHFSPLQ
jgi:hypothetical protein